MRLVSVFPLTLVLLATAVSGSVRAQSAEPFFAVGPWYPAADARAEAPSAVSTSDRDRWVRELRAIKALPSLPATEVARSGWSPN